MRFNMCAVACLGFGLFAFCQDKATVSAPREKARVFITDSQSWEIAGTSGGTSAGFGGVVKGGARPQTAEIIKTFGERCPEVVVNNKQDRADYVVLLDHEGGKGFVRKDNKVAVFNRDGDSIVSHSTMSLGTAVKDACEAITKDWPAAAKVRTGEPAIPAAGSALPTPAALKLEISSTPPDADIEIDGSFSGNTPSSVGISAGEHIIRIVKPGFTAWERKIKSSSGNVRVTAELQPVSSATQSSNTLERPRNPEQSPSPSSSAVQPKALPGTDQTAPQLRPAVMSSLESTPSSPQPPRVESTAEQTTEGAVSITSDPDGAEIFIDSVGKGSAPQLIKVKPGKHHVQLAASGYKDFVNEVEVKSGSLVNVTGRLEK